MRIFHSLLSILLFIPVISAQSPLIKNGPEGYYEGAVIRGNSAALLTADFYFENDSLVVESNIKEWTYYPPLKSKVVLQDNMLSFRTYLGPSKLLFDSLYSEMVGAVGEGAPAMQLHLKKVRRPFSPELEIRDLRVDVGDIELKAKLILPAGFARPLPCAIFVHGRGCRDRNRRLERAKILASYGMATLTFDKRGAPETGFDCDQSTIEMHTNDLLELIEKVAAVKDIDTEKIGLIGGSYGGWVAARAAARSQRKIAFMASLVGAATSIRQQQLDNAVYYTREKLGGDPKIIEQIQAYTLLEYETGNDEETFHKMQSLLLEAEKNNWIGILSKSDIPQSPEDLKKLWVKRHQYDPAEDLKGFKAPFLSILGEKDRVVPWKENAKRFEELFREVGKTNYRIVVIPSAPHRLEHGNTLRNLGRTAAFKSNSFYFKFDRVVPGVMEELIQFLKDYGFLP